MIEREDIGRVTGKVREEARRVDAQVRESGTYRKLRALPQRTQKWLIIGATVVVLLLLAQCALAVSVIAG